MENVIRADIHPEAHGELHAGAGSWQELQSMESSPDKNRFFGGTCGPWVTHTGAVFSGEIHDEAVHELLCPVVGTPCWSKRIA